MELPPNHGSSLCLLELVAERLDVLLARLWLARLRGGQRHADFRGAVAHVLGGSVDADLVARIQQCVGQVGRHLEGAARAHAGAGHALQALAVAGGQAVPVRQMLVVLGLATGHPQRAGVGPLGVRQIDGQVGAIAAVVLGGTSLSGGKGYITGTLVGVLIIGTLNNGLNILDVSSFYQQVVKGIVILLAVLMDRKKA